MGKAEIDAAIDLGDVHLEAIMELGASFGKMTDELRKFLKLQEEYEKQGPVFVPLQGALTVDGAQDPAFVDLGGPAQQRVWNVRQLIVGGPFWSSTAGGTGLILVQPNAPTPGQVGGLANVQDAFGTMPAVHFYSSDQFKVRAPNRIWLQVVTGTANAVYNAAGDAYDSPDRPLQAVSSA